MLYSIALCKNRVMIIEPIAYFYSSFPSKFGIPRQSGIVDELCGYIVFEPRYRDANAIRGLEDFDYLWIIWEFSANRSADGVAQWHPTVRPPLLGGNVAMGVFATRSPFRPNSLGLSSVRIERVEYGGERAPIIYVRGADIMDGTPIYDIKPYIEYADSHVGVRSGFVDNREWKGLDVCFPDELACRIPEKLMPALLKVLELDPRPQYQNDPEKVYGMPFDRFDIRFRVVDDILTVVDVVDVRTCGM